MVDVRGLYAQQIDVARMALIRADRPAAADSFRAAIDLARGEPGLQREMSSALVQLAKLEQELGRPAEAERLLDEALEVGEKVYGAEHPSLALALNESSRLHIRQSNHVRAKAVLERLLRISRTRGEDHPDVATALAGLALVHRKLGDLPAAERLYRDALRIREKVLAPNHMAIVVTLEQLSETCAARGNVAGALALLQRALPTRESVLGADHATVRTMRARIAALGKAQPAVPGSPAPVRRSDLIFLYQPEPTPAPEPPAPRPLPLARERMATPTYSAAVAAASLIASPIQMAHPPRPAPSARTAAPASPVRSAQPASFAKIVAPGRSHDVAPESAAHEARRDAILPLPAEPKERSSRGRTALYTLAVVGSVALAIGGVTLQPDATGGSGDATAAGDVEPRAATAATTATTNGSTMLGAASAVAAARSDSASASQASSQPLADLAEGMTAAASATAPAPPSLRIATRRMSAVKVPIVAANVDSLVRASTFADQSGLTGGLRTSPAVDDASAKPPALIAPAPVPYFPDALRSQRTEGEVLVRFRVDERGRVDMSSVKVVKSDHELFTLAVRNVLPRFRFEPGRSGAPDYKPRADWVDFRAEFTLKN